MSNVTKSSCPGSDRAATSERSARRPRTVRGAVAISAVSIVSLLAGCGGSDPDPGAATSAASGADGTTASVAEAKKLVDAASSSMLMGPGAGPAGPSDLVQASAADVQPFAFDRSGPPKRVVVVSCGPTPTCINVTKLSTAILTKIGWSAKRIQSKDLTPASFQSIWNTAVGEKPDAIISVGIAASLINPQLAKASSSGIYTVNVNGTAEGGGKGFDAYIGSGFNLANIVMSAKMVVDGGGEPNIAYMDIPQFPDLGGRYGIQYLEEHCPGCELTTSEQPVENLIDPVKTGRTATSAVRKDPDLRFLATVSSDLSIKAANQAFRTAGSDAKMVAPIISAGAVSYLRSGDLPFAVGQPDSWVALQAVDATMRGLAGEDALPPAEYPIGVALMTKDDAPAAAEVGDRELNAWFVERFDFFAPYNEAWGTDLSGVEADGA